MAETRDWNVHDWIVPHIHHLLSGDLLLCAGKASVKDFISSAHPSKDNTEPNDIFTISIPYAGLTLQWQVMLDGFNPKELPDFLIPDTDGFVPDLDDIPHLIDWNPHDPQGLFNILRDLLKLYKLHHLRLLSQVEGKFSTEVQNLSASREYPLIDACVTREGDGYNHPRTDVSVLIRIDLDSAEIPDICFKDAPPKDPCFLHPVLYIRTSTSGKIIPQLFMPPRLEHVLGGRNAMKLPSYSRQGTDLLEYVKAVHKSLHDLVAILRDGHSKRREYIAAFLCQCADNILEYDAEDFCKISLMFSFEDFYFIVHVMLGRLFPQEQPTLTFQSVYHVTKKGTLYQVPHTNYPYSPRWSGSEMVKRAKSYILEKIEAFRTGCLKNGTI